MSPKRVDSSGRITEPGEYALTSDRRTQGVVPPSEAMIQIESDNVTLDGRGHAIVGSGVSDTTAITTATQGTLTDVTVRNVRITEWEIGLHFRGVERAKVCRVDAERNSYGLLFEGVTAASVDECTVRKNLIGVALDPSAEFGLGTSEITDNQLEDILRGTDSD